jgi:hypothetical protein
MNVYLFDYWLSRACQTKDQSKLMKALDRLAQDVGRLRKRHRPSRWDAVFGASYLLAQQDHQGQVLQSLTGQLRSLSPDAAHSRLNNSIETWARTFSREDYYRFVFGILVRDGTASLSSQDAVDLLDRFRRQIESELDHAPELLGYAIYQLSFAISNLDRSKQIAFYDELYRLIVQHLGRYAHPDGDYDLMRAFAAAIEGLSRALKSFSDQYIAASQLADSAQPIFDRVKRLREQAARLPHEQMRGARLTLLAKIEQEIFERWLAETHETPIARFRIRDWKPREGRQRIRWWR